MRQQIQQSKIAIAELVVKLQEEQAKLERMEARVEKYEEAIAFLQEAIAEDPLLWEDVRDRLNPADEVEAIAKSDLTSVEKDVLSVLERNRDAQEDVSKIALPPTIIWNGNGVARLGCAKQKLAKEWAELLTLWGCATSVVKAESFSDKEIKWEVAIVNITRSQLETLAKAHTSPHAEVPTRAGSKATEGDRVDADNDDEVSATQEDGGAIQVKKLESVKNDQAMSAVLDVASNILDTYWELDTDWLDNSDFEDYPRALVSKAFDWLLDKGFVTFDEKIGWQLTQEYRRFNLDDIVTFDYEKAVKDFEKYKAQAVAIVDRESSDGEADIERDRLQSPSPDQVSDHPINSATVEEVLGGASPLSLKDEQLDELERALIAAPSIDDIADDKPSAYAEEMALKIKPGTKLKSLSFPADPKHKFSRKRTGVVRRLEREGTYIYAFVSELTETGKDSRHTAFYNLEAVEIMEEAPAIDIAFDRFEPFDPTEDALGMVEAEILQFLKEKSAQADLYQDNQPDASISEILAATKLEGADRELALDALEKIKAKGLVSFDGDRWQIASEKPAQKEHNFKVGDRVTICGDSKGEDLIGKTGTLTAVSVTGCVLCLDGEDGKTRLFFCKEDLTPCSTFSQAA